jgi:hypothetical protein
MSRRRQQSRSSHAYCVGDYEQAMEHALAVYEGADTRAAAMLMFCLEHEAMPAAYRLVAQPTLDELRERLDPEELAAAREAAAGLDLDELALDTPGTRVR